MITYINTIFVCLFINNNVISFNLRIVPACACDSKTIMEESSRFILVDKCERAVMCKSSSKISSSSSGVRSCELKLIIIQLIESFICVPYRKRNAINSFKTNSFA